MRYLIILLGSLAFAPSAFGAAHGIFSGLSDLIGNSQAIVVALVESPPKTPRTHSGNSRAVQKVRVLYSLKGNFQPEQRIDVALDSEILFPASTYLAVDDYPVYERYVLFIAKDSLSPDGYGIVNAEGGAFWVPREADLSLLTPGNLRGNLEVLLQAVSSYAASRDRVLGERLQKYFSEEPQR
ncbi:MAG TPA: hypothetical protein VF329_01905 [Gammaproteobacteria bacterium]